MSGFTDFLYARPSFISGIARALDMGNTLSAYNSAATESQADQLAIVSDCASLRKDWQAVQAKHESQLPKLKQEILEEARQILGENV